MALPRRAVGTVGVDDSRADPGVDGSDREASLTRSSSGTRQTAVAAVAPAELGDGAGELGGIELGPHARREVQLGIGGFPEHEIAESLFAAGADQKIDIGG